MAPRPYPTVTNLGLVHVIASVCVCVFLRVSVDIFPALPRERRLSEKYSHVLSGELSSAMFAPLFPFSLTLLLKKISPFCAPFAFSSSSSCHIVRTGADLLPLFVRCWELFKCSPLPLSSALCCELGSFGGMEEELEG